MTGMTLEPLQKAVYAALTADAALMAIITGVYDAAPASANFPFIVFGRIEAVNRDSMAARREQVRLAFDIFSRAGGRKQADDILKRLHELLHWKPLAMTAGFTLAKMHMESSGVGLEADGITWRGRANLAALVAQS